MGKTKCMPAQVVLGLRKGMESMLVSMPVTRGASARKPCYLMRGYSETRGSRRARPLPTDIPSLFLQESGMGINRMKVERQPRQDFEGRWRGGIDDCGGGIAVAREEYNPKEMRKERQHGQQGLSLPLPERLLPESDEDKAAFARENTAKLTGGAEGEVIFSCSLITTSPPAASPLAYRNA